MDGSATSTTTKAPDGEASAFYGQHRAEREPYLIRARRCARLTIPYLFREYGENGTTTETLPWQTENAYGVNNLSAKLVMVLFPPGIPFINLKQTKEALMSLSALSDPDTRGKLKAEIDKGLSGVEQEFIDGVEEDGDRAKLFDTIRHLVVGGNHALKVNPKTGILSSIPLERYVTVRDKEGNLYDWCVEDTLAWETLPPDIQQMCQDNGYQIDRGTNAPQAPVCVYTRGTLKNGQWTTYQECYGKRVPGSDYTYNPDALPYLFLRLISLEKEHYGRSYCEDYEGDLQTLDGYWQILTEGAAGIARLIWLIKAGSTVNKKQFSEAANGATLTGDPDEVGAARAEKGGDLAFALKLLEMVSARIEKIFIVNSAIQRTGERVTAEEIKFMAQELETTLGGVYSNQVNEFQARYARLKLDTMQRQGRVTKLPKGTVKVTILTGDAALGRMQKAQSLDEFIASATQAIQPNSPIAPYLNISTYLARSAANRRIDTDGLIRSEDEVKQEQAQQQQQAMMANVAPEVVRQGGQMIQNSVANQTAAAPSPTDQPPQPAPAAA